MFDHRNGKRLLIITWVAVVAVAMNEKTAAACSVCFGAKDDPMVQATGKSVLLMIGVTYAVLLGMGAMMVTWFVRGRRRVINATKSEQN